MKNYLLKQLRQVNRLSQDDMAKEIGMSRGTYVAKENGRSDFTVGEIASIAAKFNLEVIDVCKIFLKNLVP